MGSKSKHRASFFMKNVMTHLPKRLNSTSWGGTSTDTDDDDNEGVHLDYSSFSNLLGRDVKGHGSEVDTAKTIHTRDDKEDARALQSAKCKVQDRTAKCEIETKIMKTAHAQCVFV